jgi:alanine or glycine:cation symporter, AGCS family
MQYFSFDDLTQMVDSLWGYVGFPIIIFLGLFFSVRSKFVQVRKFPTIFRNFITTFFGTRNSDPSALHPIRAFFASIGGSLGIGNVVAVAAAVKIGGPGTIVWIWATAIVGSLIKYSEVYLGIIKRKHTEEGKTIGGPLIFLQEAFGSAWPAKLFCVLICIYSVEIYQFGVVASVTSQSLGVSKWITALVFLSVIVLVERGGFRRVGAIASCIVPFLVFVYVSMGSYVFFANMDILPSVFADIIASAFTTRAAEGAFVGSSLLFTMAQGVRSGCYSSDIGVGYASIIHSASTTTQPAKQASLLIFEIFMDTFFVCTMSVLLVLVTGTWKEDINSVQLIEASLGRYFPCMNIFMPVFLTLLGYNVVSTYFSTGMYTIRYFMPTIGPKIFYCYALVAFLLSTFVEVGAAITVMAFVGFLLLALNAFGIWKLRDQVSFAVEVPVLEPILNG